MLLQVVKNKLQIMTTVKTITEVIPAAGEVRRLTASVMVDGNLDSDTQEAF